MCLFFFIATTIVGVSGRGTVVSRIGIATTTSSSNVAISRTTIIGSGKFVLSQGHVGIQFDQSALTSLMACRNNINKQSKGEQYHQQTHSRIPCARIVVPIVTCSAQGGLFKYIVEFDNLFTKSRVLSCECVKFALKFFDVHFLAHPRKLRRFAILQQSPMPLYRFVVIVQGRGRGRKSDRGGDGWRG